jgi:hypothetical protein
MDCREVHLDCDAVEWNGTGPDKLKIKVLSFPEVMYFYISVLKWAAGTVQDNRNVLKSSFNTPAYGVLMLYRNEQSPCRRQNVIRSVSKQRKP